MMCNIIFATGTRADFSKLLPLADVASEFAEEVIFFATGMHLLKKYGLTIEEVRQKSKGRVHEFLNQSVDDTQDIVMAKTMLGFGDFLRETEADMVVVHGDRVEALAIALSAVMNNVLVMHVEGGEVSGTIDESIRHCISKAAHIHMVSSEDAANRLRRMGESSDMIHIIGSPELELHKKTENLPLSDAFSHYELDFDDYGIFLMHPVTTELHNLPEQLDAVTDAMHRSDKNFVVILPNNDPGTSQIVEAIETLDRKRFRVFSSMRFEYFSSLLRNASVIVGNSSVGVREAPFLGIGSVNIGTRQNNRASGQSITHLDGFDADAILMAITDLWGKRFPVDESFGDGGVSQKFRLAMTSLAKGTVALQKSYVD